MAAHVVVIDSTARQAKIKTTPEKYLTDVLEEACTKLGRDSVRYGLKHKNKNLDLSRTIRLSGLISGAKLELVQSSRSPSVVSVALQLPEAEPDGSIRLTDKFPSTTTLWLILRKFESTGGSARNFTARGIPVTGGEAKGSGRLFFQTPVLQIMNRELSSFTDLQKTLAQLGLNDGSALLRLTFRKTETPLEEAMTQIGQYFKEVEAQEPNGAHAKSAGDFVSKPAGDEPVLSDEAGAPSPAEPASPSEIEFTPTASQTNLQESSTTASEGAGAGPATPPSEPIQTITGPSQRRISVFAPPSSSTPKAALHKDNENDFEPTLDHVKSHQKYLQANSQNKQLKSDAELAAQAEAQALKNAQIKEVVIKVRFPDESQVSAPFTNLDTATTLYEHVRGLMQHPTEPISLKFTTNAGPKPVPISSDVKLISGLGIVGRVLVNVIWEPEASNQARIGPSLKEEYRAKAQEIQVKEIQGVDVEEKSAPTDVKGKGKEEKGERKGGMPKWFKGLGKK